MGIVRPILVAIIIVAPSIAIGASFNCLKAGTSVEKTICASKTLSSLDEQLAKAYKSVILLSDHPDVDKSHQNEWLRNIRDKCQNEACLKNAYERRLAQLAATQQADWETFRDENLGIEFAYPTNRKVKIGCRGSKNCIALIGKPMPNSEYIIAFEVFEGDLEKIAVEQAVFEKINNVWIAKGRFSEHSVAPLAGLGWQGIKSTVSCGISDSTGFHAGAGECLWVVLSNGRRSVVVDTQGIVGNDEASMRSIQSLRLSK
ncbi:lysozyme inhibitor LprI family protein [Methylobacter tundripaludum]|uniref:lysozyme inhibitor LprI family protein n=1 Tax=Methylobacter tundripaludum TaxID=173365 RepID=UPI000484F66F|nr:hypothetical protein [Methylobacter tundripaludum]